MPPLGRKRLRPCTLIMIYCDIHTHKTEPGPGHLAIVNKMIDASRSLCFLPGFYYSYGIHPWYIGNREMQFALLTEALLHPSVVALGEAGLDKNAEAPMELQVEVFTEQAALAEEIGKPVIIHCVKAWDELLAVKKSVNPKQNWILHGYRGNEIQAKQLIGKGFRLSFGANHNPGAVRAAWPGHILAETDESEIKIEAVYAGIAASLDIPVDLLASTLRDNVKEIFSI